MTTDALCSDNPFGGGHKMADHQCQWCFLDWDAIVRQAQRKRQAEQKETRA